MTNIFDDQPAGNIFDDVPSSAPLGAIGTSSIAAEPSGLRSFGSFLTKGVKDVAVSTAAGLPGFGLLLAGSPMWAARKAVEAVTGKSVEPFAAEQYIGSTAFHLLSLAAATYDDVTDAQADMAVAMSRSTGLPIEATAPVTTGGFAVLNAISPGKYARIALGMGIGTAALAYGTTRLLGKAGASTFRGVNKIARNAMRSGDAVDAMRSLSQAEDLVEDMLPRAIGPEIPEQALTIAHRAREAVAAEGQAFLPGVVDDIPQNVLVAARREAGVRGPLTKGMRRGKTDPLGVERAAISYLDEMDAGNAKGAREIIRGREREARKIAQDSKDPVLRGLYEDQVKGYVELGYSVEDAGRLASFRSGLLPGEAAEGIGARAGKQTILPTDVPTIMFPRSLEEIKEVALNLGHRYLYRREYGFAQMADRARVLKSVLSSEDAIPRTQIRARKAARIADRQLREDMTFYIQRTGNPNVSKTEGVADVVSRMRQHEKGEAAIALADNLRPWLDNLFEEMAELNVKLGDKEIDYIENWLHQAWKPPKEGGILGFGSTRGVLDSGYFRSRDKATQALARVRGRFEEARTIPSYRAGILSGMEPRTLDSVQLLQLAERQYGETMATKKLLGELADLNALADGSRAFLKVVDGKFPKGVNADDYVKAEVPYLRRFAEQSSGDMWLHRDLYKPLRNIIEGLSTPQTNFIDDLSAINKRANFTYTMFHAYSLAENAILSLGLARGARTLGRVVSSGGGIPFADRIGGPRAFDQLLSTGTMKDASVRALKYNVVIETPTTDLMRSQWEKAVESVIENLSKRGITGKAAAKALDRIAWAQKHFDTALWERMHHPLKVTVFNELYDTMLRIKKAGGKGYHGFKQGGLWGRLKGKDIAKLSDDEIGYRVAAFVNDEFGGQRWEVLQGKLMGFLSRPDVLRQLRRAFISPDWNISSFRANLAFLSLFGGDPVRGVLGARHWRNVIIGTGLASHALNYALTSAFEGKGRFAFENDPGKEGMAAGIIPTYIATGLKNKDGRRIYVRAMKQIQEVPEFIENPVDFMGRKMIPWARTIIDMAAKEKDPFSFVGKAVQRARQEGVELDGVDYFLLYGADMANAFSPFSATFSPLKQQPPLGDVAPFKHLGGRGSDLLVPLPQSLGAARGDLQRRMQKAIRSKNWREMRRINRSLMENGYTPVEITTIFNTAQTLAWKQGAN